MVSNKRHKSLKDRLEDYTLFWSAIEEVLYCDKTIILEKRRVVVLEKQTGIEASAHATGGIYDQRKYAGAISYALAEVKEKHQEYLNKCVADKVKEEQKQE